MTPVPTPPPTPGLAPVPALVIGVSESPESTLEGFRLRQWSPEGPHPRRPPVQSGRPLGEPNRGGSPFPSRDGDPPSPSHRTQLNNEKKGEKITFIHLLRKNNPILHICVAKGETLP